MFSGPYRKGIILAFCLTVPMGLTIACPGLSAKPENKYRMIQTELQAEQMALADRMASYLVHALRDFAQLPGADDKRPLVQKEAVGKGS